MANLIYKENMADHYFCDDISGEQEIKENEFEELAKVNSSDTDKNNNNNNDEEEDDEEEENEKEEDLLKHLDKYLNKLFYNKFSKEKFFITRY